MKVTYYICELGIFLYKQASAALFGGLLLASLLLSTYISIPGLYRYDALFIVAIIIQLVLIITKLEHWREVAAIIIFHILAMGMELYKTSSMVGSWSYPEEAILAIGSVPLFTGFMYSSVGSYIARSWRINNFRFINLPKKSILILFAIAIYVNFFTNHFVMDIRIPLFILLVIAFWKTKFFVTLTSKTYSIHPLVSNALLALVIWGAEQVGTFAKAWVYPTQVGGWQPVKFHFFTSWYMLLIFSFILISFLYKRTDDMNE